MTAVDGAERVGAKPLLTALAWSVAAASMVAFAAAWVLAARNRDLLDVSAGFSPDRFMVGYPAVGAVLASRRRSNPIGWFLLGVGLVTSARALAGEYALHALVGPSHPPYPPAGVWAAWFVGWSLTLLFPGGLLTFLLLLFPDGQPLTAWWWVVGWAAAGLTAVSVVVTWLDPGTVTVAGLPGVPNPTGLRGRIHIPTTGPFGGGTWVLGGVCLLLAAASLFVRYRRSAADERLQLKWFVYVAVLSLGLLAALVPFASTSNFGNVAFDATIVAGIGLALPVAVGIAILKYRLYAIDRIISRTVSYTVVTGAVAGVYLGCIAVLTRVLPVRGSVGVAVAVLAAVALFNPLRRRVQAVVDQRFDRARYNAERVVAQFSVQLREEVDLDVLGADLIGVVDHVLAPTHLGLWMSGTVSPSTVPAAQADDSAPSTAAERGVTAAMSPTAGWAAAGPEE
jgi:LPXTG-motif cell wall-anchored protein